MPNYLQRLCTYHTNSGFTTPKQPYDTCLSHHKMGASRKGTLSSYLDKKTYEAKLLQLMLTACCLAHTALNIWNYLRLPDGCYPVADLPCWDGILTRWKYRPCSAAPPIDYASLIRPLIRVTSFRGRKKIASGDFGCDEVYKGTYRYGEVCATWIDDVYSSAPCRILTQYHL